MSDPQEIFLKLRKLYPEDPDEIRAESAKKKEADREQQKMFMEIHDRHVRLEKARRAAIAKKKEMQFKPKQNPNRPDAGVEKPPNTEELYG